MKNYDKDTVLKRIINHLTINGPFVPSLGLLDGRMGIIILFYEYGRYSGQKKYEELAGEMLDHLFEEISLQTSMSFSSGLTGIGWGIEYLVQNKFVEADTNEVLRELDTTIFQTDKKEPQLEQDLNDYYGYGLYYLSRTRDGNKPKEESEMLRLIQKDIQCLPAFNRIHENWIFSMEYVISEFSQRNVVFDYDDYSQETGRNKGDHVNEDQDDLSKKISDIFLNPSLPNWGFNNGWAGWAWYIMRNL